MFLEVEEGRQDRDEEAVKVYLIRFTADLPLSRYYTDCVIEYLLKKKEKKKEEKSSPQNRTRVPLMNGHKNRSCANLC